MSAVTSWNMFETQVPLAQLVESKFPSLQSELQALQSDPGFFDELSFEHSKVEAMIAVQ